MKRRLLPLTAVRSFEAAARRGSVTIAADELGVTVSAVSRQIGELERLLDVRLLHKVGRGLALTNAGATLAKSLTEALDIIGGALVGARNDGTGRGARTDCRILRVDAVTTLATRLVLPRMSSFEDAHPEVLVNLRVASVVDTAASEEVDLVLSYTRHFPSDPYVIVFRDEAQPMAAPSYLARAEGWGRSGILEHGRLLSAADEWWDWRSWAQAQGIVLPLRPTVMTFESDDLAIQAAAVGAGIVLADARLVGPELEAGRLVRVIPHLEPTPMGWYIADTNGAHGDAVRLVDWIRSSIASQER